jgi:hypothetical protein
MRAALVREEREVPDHPVGWVALQETQNRQCSCAFRHLLPFSSGRNFFPLPRHVLIKNLGRKPH